MEPFVHICSYPLSVRFLSGGKELRWGASVRQVLLHSCVNQDLSPTCCFFLFLTWWAHCESICHPILLLVLPVHYQKRRSLHILLYSLLCGEALGFAYFDWRPHQQCGVGSYDTTFAIYCSCHLEMKEWIGLNKPLAEWRMDAEQEGIEIGEEDSTGEGGESEELLDAKHGAEAWSLKKLDFL